MINVNKLHIILVFIHNCVYTKKILPVIGWVTTSCFVKSKNV